MSVVRKYKKWGMPFSIIGFIMGIVSIVNSFMFVISMSVWSNVQYSVPSGQMSTVAIAMLITIGASIVTGIIFSILGLIGWSKKSLSVIGIVFSLLPLLICGFVFFLNIM